MALRGRRAAYAEWLGATNDVTRTFLAAGRIPGLINLAGGLPAPELLPTDAVSEIAGRVVAEHPAETLGYGPIEGLPELREALAARHSSSSLRLSAENVLVVTSGMQGLDLMGKALLDPGDLIAGHHPTYLGALDAWRPRSPRYRDLLLDDAACDLKAALDGAKFAYAVPNFSNPTGRLVATPIRRALAAASRETGAWILEDDPYGALLYDAEPSPRLIDLDAEAEAGDGLYRGSIVYLGSMSKVISPGLRIGWMIGAPEMIETLTLAKQGSDMCTSGVTQRIAAEAITSGLIEQINPPMLALYRARRDALCAAMEAHLGEWFDWEKPVGGMFVWARSKSGRLDTDKLLTYAMDAKVCVSPSSVFDAAGADRGAIRVNFTYNPPDALEEGVRRLAAAIRRMAEKGEPT